ncbi:MAG TPA: hypothetical protein VLW75_12185 [Rhizomicrobium sp.]|nr:hypothetical protein [Rhizomicrobium sp.]
MSKYEPLGTFLKAKGAREIPLTFRDVEKILGTKLPASAYHHRPWWANEARGHVHAKAWLEAGYEAAEVDMGARKLVFKRASYGAAPMTPHKGMAEQQSDHKDDDYVIPSTVSKAPIFGALKGLLWIEPGYDLAQSPFSKEELDEMDRRMEEKAALIEAGLKKPK